VRSMICHALKNLLIVCVSPRVAPLDPAPKQTASAHFLFAFNERQLCKLQQKLARRRKYSFARNFPYCPRSTKLLQPFKLDIRCFPRERPNPLQVPTHCLPFKPISIFDPFSKLSTLIFPGHHIFFFRFCATSERIEASHMNLSV